jgi:hypothetical protein
MDYRAVHLTNCSFHTDSIYSSTPNTNIFSNAFSFHYFYNKFPSKFQFIDPFPLSSNSLNAFLKTKTEEDKKEERIAPT